MSKKYIYMLFIFLMFVVSTSPYFLKYINVEQVKQVYDSNDLMCKYSISNIKEEKENYKIQVYYPVTQIKELNVEIMKKIDNCIKEFKDTLTDSNNELIIQFNSYENNIYTSFVFELTINNINSHEEKQIFCFNFDNKQNKIITIDDILKSNNDSLENISNIIYENLKTMPEIIKNVDKNVLRKYLNLDKEKYNCFYFSKNSIIFCLNKSDIISKKTGIVYVPVSIDDI